jgi:hypothetical protein
MAGGCSLKLTALIITFIFVTLILFSIHTLTLAYFFFFALLIVCMGGIIYEAEAKL